MNRSPVTCGTSALEERDVELILESVGPHVEELRNARVCVTGASGFFGVWLIEALCAIERRLALGLRVVGVARSPDVLRSRTPHLFATTPALVETVACDVRELPVDLGATHVIHAATPSVAHGLAPNPNELVSVIVDGTRRVLRASGGARRFLFVSSGAVYGSQPPDLLALSEDYLGGPDPLSPRSAYAEGKRLAELCCAIAAAGGDSLAVPAVIARPFAFVGPWLPLDEHFAIGNFLGDALAGRPIVVQGDGTPVRSYLYAADLAAWLLVMLLAGTPGRAYNVGGPEPIALGGLAAIMGARFGVAVDVRGRSTPGVRSDRYVPSVRRAEDELGLRVRVPLGNALDRTFTWHRRRAGGAASTS